MNPLYNAVVYVVWFLSTYYVVLLLLVLLANRNRLHDRPSRMTGRPRVSIIVPAYNEEEDIGRTIASLKRLAYAPLEFVIVNDGSTDRTGEAVRAAVSGDSRFLFIDRKENRGKAVSLNEAIARCKGEFVACMDADSEVESDVLEKVLPFFEDPRMGAVTITVEVRGPKTFLQKVIDIEYIIGLSLFLKLFSFFDSIFVTPGPFSIYRKSVLHAIGCFDAGNITEDLEIAYRIQKGGYRIANCLDARVFTATPPTFRGTYVQRRRWHLGALQTVMQHRDVLFNGRMGMFGFVIPLNFLLAFSGLLLFYSSLYLLLHRLWEQLHYLSYTGFNIQERLLQFEIDLLSTGTITLVGVFAFAFTIVLMFLGLRAAGKSLSKKRVGMLGFPFMFFLYQVFWTGAFLAALSKRRIRWR
ncbi:glycosyltransferase family 2 protein [Candidatus Woesearchaeota archaeon]|nr:glycosyltransferase family 2 protein [Candidatus Woesearchaeota archaeon]